MEIKELENKILEAKKAYYSGTSVLTDDQYDALENTLKALNANSKILEVVGYQIDPRGKIKHDKKMLSLEKVKTQKDLMNFCHQFDGMTCTFKMDGSSGSLLYENGKFFLAKTRGNGEFGEVVTKQTEFIEFPKEIPLKNKVEIRGEVLINYKNFELVKKEIESLEQEVPTSHRNVVSGLLHRKENLELCRHLSFVAYEIIVDGTEKVFDTEQAKLIYLKEIGFEIPKSFFLLGRTVDSVFPQIEEAYNTYMESQEYLTDGLVFAVDNCKLHEELGYTSHHPKYKSAFKFKSETAVTKVKDIEIGLGRTGKITIVGIVEPTELSGCTINRVTFHNVAYVKEHQINIGALIEITRSNEVIPKHNSTIESSGDFEFPTVCPSCGCNLTMTETDTDLICTNDLCESKKFARILHWIETAEIFDLGEGNLIKMWDAGLVKEVSDLYKLTVQDLLKLDGFQISLANKIINSIKATEKLESFKLLAGFGISNVGKRMSKTILEKYQSVDNLISLKENQDFLNGIKGIGPKIIEKVYLFLSNNEMLNQINRTREFVQEIIVEKKQGVLSEKSIVITGTLTRPRKQIEADIENAGGKNSSSISSTTNYLVANEISSSSKFVKAQKLGVKIISEKELYEILEG